MKKILLTTAALLSIASAQVFGMYGVDSDWIDFLTHGNQFRARLKQLGFTLGNDTIKGTFGFNNPDNLGAILSTVTSTNGATSPHAQLGKFIPNISAGIGYTSSAISVGVGYTVSITDVWRGTDGKAHQQAAHTPTLVLNALDNAFRMAIPIQVYVNNDKDVDGNKTSEMAVSVDSQFRYYTGLDVLPQVRLYLRYGLYQFEDNPAQGDKTKTKYGESFGFDLRFYFGSVVEEVALQPLVKLAYNGALGNYHNNNRIQAVKAMNGDYNTQPTWGNGTYDLTLMTGLGLTANSDIVSLYLEPQLGLSVTKSAPRGSSATLPGETPAPASIAKESYGLAYNVYAEIYITPIKNLEWYFEAEIGGSSSYQPSQLVFNGTTGVTWYLPAL